MRYIRFLKTPRIVGREKVDFLITITSDLGDSFLPYHVGLVAEVCSSKSGSVISSTKVEWSAGLRSLPITVALKSQKVKGPLFVRVGVVPKTSRDVLNNLFVPCSRGVVSAFSAELDPLNDINQAKKMVQRCFSFSSRYGTPTSVGKEDLQFTVDVQIWEEGGESIARHLWDAGISLSAHVVVLLSKSDTSSDAIAKAFSPPSNSRPLRVLELGTGCGIVGKTIAQHVPNAGIILTDLPEASEIVDCNIKDAKVAKDTTISFQELDWEAELPENISQIPMDIAVAADCTYNSDSSPALVNTLSRLAKISPNIAVIIAMKIRHSSEGVFFDLMADAGFAKIHSPEIPLPGDEQPGEETVHIHLFRQERHNKSSDANQLLSAIDQIASTKIQRKRRHSSTETPKRSRK